jgi:hypothetical protein
MYQKRVLWYFYYRSKNMKISDNYVELNRVSACKYLVVTLIEELTCMRNQIKFIYSNLIKLVCIYETNSLLQH